MTYYEDDTDGEPISNGTSVRRYKPDSRPMLLGDDRSDYTVYITSTQNSNAKTTVPQRASKTIDYTLRAQQPRRDPGPRYLPDEQYQAVQKQQREQGKPRRSQPAQPQPQRDTTGQQRRVYGRRRVIFEALLGGAALLAPAIIYGTAPKSMAEHWITQFETGNSVSKDVELVCGHNDSDTNKTLLHLFVQGAYICMIEQPGGDASKAEFSHSALLSTMGFTGNISDLSLDAALVAAGDGKQQLHIVAHWQPIGVLKQSVDFDWYLQDSGQYWQSAK